MKTVINNEHKDRLFKFLFGNPENRMWTLNLYNAINNSNYDDPENIQFNTIEEAVYLGMKNDVSFIIMSELNLWEHQSTYNPNMPMRFFIYAAKLYEKYIASSEYYPYIVVQFSMFLTPNVYAFIMEQRGSQNVKN